MLMEPGGRNRPRNKEGGTSQGTRREEPAKEPGGRNRPRNQEGGTGQGTRREEPAKEPGGRNRPRNQEGGTGQGTRREEPAKEPGGRNRPRNQEGGTGQGTRREEPAKEPGGRNRPRNQEGGTGQGTRREEPAKEPGGRNRPRNQEGGTGQGTRTEGRELGREVGRKRVGKGGSSALDPQTPSDPEVNTPPADSAALSSPQPPSWLHVITARYLLTNLEEVRDPGHAKPAASVRDLQLVAGVVNLSPASSRPRATQGPLWVPLEIAAAREHCLQDPGAEQKALVPVWLEQDKTQRPRIVS
ncbi:unnamed protein product [Arctogadus glacialis]